MVEIVALGKQVKAVRKALGLTQVQLAELAELSYRPIYRLEDGESIQLETLVKICDALGYAVAIVPKGERPLE